MNDAVESFLVFRDARMTGEYHAEYEGELEASLNKQGEEFVLVVKQGKTVLTLFLKRWIWKCICMNMHTPDISGLRDMNI